MKNIEEYLKYYVGQTAWFTIGGISGKCVIDHKLLSQDVEVKPFLKKLSDMTEEEMIMVLHMHMSPGWKGVEVLAPTDDDWALRVEDRHGNRKSLYVSKKKFNPDTFHYLLSKGYWLWDDSAFTSGLILDAKNVK